MINFIAGGMMGDFIHSLYALKNICEQKNDKANLYITDGHGGDVWRFALQKTYDDLQELITSQNYINKFEILDIQNFKEDFVNLNDWRKNLEHTPAGYVKCWSEVLSKCYNFSIPKQYNWINCNKVDINAQNKILIHRSLHRINGEFPWRRLLGNLQEDVLFLTSNEKEWESFAFKNNKISMHYVSSITEMTTAINSCKMFIGNQSAPFAIACALDKLRMVELDADPAKFYMDENKYSNNISWFLNNENKFSSPNALLQL